MHEVIIGLVILFWILNGIYRFFKWVAASIKGAVTPPVVTAPLPTSVLPAPMAGAPPIPKPPQRLQSQALPRRPDKTGLLAASDATSASFAAREAQFLAGEPSPLGSLEETPPPGSMPPAASGLFSSTDDLVRAFILHEVLDPPLSRRTPSK